jgi:DNA repair exonuclease SbcCD nuclease subunit
MFTFIHAADIHLDSPLLKLDQYEGSPVEALRGATRRAMENLVELAAARPVDFVLIAGDLYDGDWRDYNTGLYFVSQMARLREAGIPVMIIAGNHDAASRMTRTLRLPDNVTLFPADHPDTVILSGLNAAIHGQSFSSPAVKRNLAVQYPEPLSGHVNIGMLHTGLTGREGHEPYAPCSLEELVSKGYDYWALGHVHQREILSEHPLIVFSGNIQGRHIRETGSKGCMVVEVDGDGRMTPEFQPLDVIRWAYAPVDVSDDTDGYSVVGKVSEQLAQILEENEGMALAVRVEISGQSKAHEALHSAPDHWVQEIRSAALDAGAGQIWVEKVRFLTHSASEKTEEIPDGPVGEILRVFDPAQSNPELLGSLKESLADLEKKLPKEIRDIPDIFAPDDGQWLAQALAEVRPLLLGRLMPGGGTR